MNSDEQIIIDNFLNKANHKIAKENLKFLSKDNYISKNDIILGISISDIKNYVKNIPILELNSVFELIQSEYNEARILGWSLLVRDYSKIEILNFSVLNYSNYCGSINVVDFAANLISKTLLKNYSYSSVKNLGYRLLFNNESILTKRFSLLMSIPLIHKNKLNYGIDIVERCLDSSDESINKICGIILKEIRIKNTHIFLEFIKENNLAISKITYNFAFEN